MQYGRIILGTWGWFLCKGGGLGEHLRRARRACVDFSCFGRMLIFPPICLSTLVANVSAKVMSHSPWFRGQLCCLPTKFAQDRYARRRDKLEQELKGDQDRSLCLRPGFHIFFGSAKSGNLGQLSLSPVESKKSWDVRIECQSRNMDQDHQKCMCVCVFDVICW